VDMMQGGDIEAMVCGKGLPFEILPGDLILANSIQFTVIDTRPVYAPGGAVLEVGCLVRK